MENQNWTMYVTVIFGCLFAISEALTVIPSVKSNGVFQMIYNVLKTITGKDKQV